MEATKIIKNYTDTLLYKKGDLDKDLIKAIMQAERLDMSDDKKFEDIRYQVKRRQVTGSLSIIMNHPSIVFIDTKSAPLGKQFKVFAARDIKKDKKLKIFVDVNRVLFEQNGIYTTNSIDIFIAYLTSALFQYLYFSKNVAIINNAKLQSTTNEIFSRLVLNIIDNLYKISLVDGRKEMCLYLSSLYCSGNLFGLDITNQSVRDLAKKIAKISDRQAEVNDLQVNDLFTKDINGFIMNLSNILKLDKLNLDNFIAKWGFIYGPGTYLSLEYLPALSTTITDAYIGSYINNQKSIEKVVGNLLEDYSKNLFLIGEGVMRNEKY